MRILVAVKRVVDANVSVRVTADGTGIALSNVKMSMNPFDEIAVEAAVRLKEAGQANEVIAVSVGVPSCQETLRCALAMGADRAILITPTDAEADVEPLAVAKLLARLVDRTRPDLVVMGKQAIDNDCNATGQMLAALLGWPQATFASALDLCAGQATVTREVDGGLQTITTTIPAVITVDLRLNQPRYARLPNIMKAKKKPLEVIPSADFDVDLRCRLTVVSITEPPGRSAGVMVGSVAELVEKLTDDAGVL